MEQLVYTEEQLSQLLGVAKTTLWRWRKSKRDCPKWRRVAGHKVVYSVKAVNEWLAGNSEYVGNEKRSGK